ncbi:Noc2p family-domain-containing protein [Zychaea mexicana]|uniref:Noc2p family-domain-containing protein n=1 Tax=Zychaea mexicana TaxID=64656 RepID=UPI0022FED57F|nr:Noc2p family-domain-containing protein [Zychaea mexicana]KAI9499419.1 Noc2p family-domain-containing protein [Zychaea mexicana]
MAKSHKNQNGSKKLNQKGKSKAGVSKAPKNGKPGKVMKKEKPSVTKPAGKGSSSKKAEKKSDNTKMSVEDFFAGGFDASGSDDDLDKELEAMEKVEDDAVVDDSDDDDDDEEDMVEDLVMSENLVNDKEDVSDAIDEDEDDDENQDDLEASDDAKQSSEDDDDSSDEENGNDDKDDDDEDIDNSKKLNKDIKRHKKELEQLKKQDPEFFKYLQKEENALLEFDESEKEDDEDEDENEGSDEELGSEDLDGMDVDMDDENLEQESDSEAEMDGDEDDESGLEVLTKSMLNEWIEEVETKQSVNAMKKLLVAFKSAARMSDEEKLERVSLVYRIVNPNVFNQLVVATMRNAPIIFNRVFKCGQGNKSPATATRWQYHQGMVKLYLSNLIHLMSGLTDSDMLYVAVREAEKCSAYWACYDKYAKEYLKILLNMWSNFTSSDNVRIQSFLAIRSLTTAPVPKATKQSTYLDLALKNIYLTFVRNCKNTNAHTLPAINLMRNLAVQLYGIDQELSYQQAFVYIRQLAITLRNAMQTKTKESYTSVYNWQFIHCIDFWANVLAANCQDESSELRPLIYPLAQVALGTIKLVPDAQYYPLRFHVLRSMTTLGVSTKVFIPLAPYMFELFESPALTKQAKPSTLKPLQWDIHLKTPQNYLRGRVFQDGVLEQLNECILNYYKGYFYHIAYPEMVIPGIVAIKRFLKKSKPSKQSKKLHDLASKLDIKSKYILTQRSKIDFSPTDQVDVDKFIKEMQQKLL